MSELLPCVDEAIAARGLLRRGQHLLVAVSGGLDSMVMLEILRQLASRHKWHLAVAHLNHQLRGRSSDADERLVRLIAARHQLSLIVESANVRQFARSHKLSIEMAARQLRHEFLARSARKNRIKTIALAHHADDQLELFFLRLLRGSSTAGLAGMKWRNPSPADPHIQLVRPLLNCKKSELQAFAAESKIRFREDATNSSIEIQRNRVRHELLPLLRKHYQPALSRTIARAAEIIRAESDLANQLALEWLATNRRVRFEELPLAVQRRVIYLQLVKAELQPEFGLIENLRERPGCLFTVPRTSSRPPASIRRDETGRVQVQPCSREHFTDSCLFLDLDTTRTANFQNVTLRWRTHPRRLSQRLEFGSGSELFDADKIGRTIVLRHWRPGDRFQPIGMTKPVKLQDLFTNAKVPRDCRHELVLAGNSEGELFWVEGLRIAERFKLTKETIRVLQWRWKRM